MTRIAPTQTTAARGSRAFRVPGLDGLRAVAVTLVVLFHLTPVLPGGDIGVDVFFVISGFLITSLLLRERLETGGIAVGAFWRRRARRLLPALAALIVVCGSAAFALGGDVLVGLGRQVLGALTFSINWVFIAEGSDYFDQTSPELFRNLWSLAVEEQFYLLWPLLLIAVVVRLSPVRRAVLLGAGALASAAAMALLVGPAGAARVYYGTDTHCFGLLIGALLATLTLWWSPRALEWSRAARGALTVGGLAAGLGVVALAVVMPAGSPAPFYGGLLLASALTAVAIAGLLVPGSPLARALDVRSVRWVGRRSYGIYLWHWPVFVLLMQAFPTWPRPEEGAWGIGLVAIAITLAAAALSFRYLEEPIRRAGYRGWLRETGAAWRRSARSLTAGLVALLLAVGGVAGTAAAIVADPGASESQTYIEAGQRALDEAEEGDQGADAAPTPGPDDATSATPAPTASEEPGRFTHVRGDQISAIGDSVMLAATPSLQTSFPGIAIDARVSRQMRAAPIVVQRKLDAGKLRDVVVIALGTNGSISRDTLVKVREMIGPDRRLVLVTIQAPRGYTTSVNQILRKFAADYRDVELANWHAAVKGHRDLLADDQVHFGKSGGALFAKQIEDAVARLAEIRAPRHRPTP